MEFFVLTGFACFALLAIDLNDSLRSAAVLRGETGALAPAAAIPVGNADSAAVEYDRAA